MGFILTLLLTALAWARSLRREGIKRTAAFVSNTRARRDTEVEFSATSRERERLAASGSSRVTHRDWRKAISACKACASG